MKKIYKVFLSKLSFKTSTYVQQLLQIKQQQVFLHNNIFFLTAPTDLCPSLDRLKNSTNVNIEISFFFSLLMNLKKFFYPNLTEIILNLNQWF